MSYFVNIFKMYPIGFKKNETMGWCSLAIFKNIPQYLTPRTATGDSPIHRGDQLSVL